MKDATDLSLWLLDELDGLVAYEGLPIPDCEHGTMRDDAFALVSRKDSRRFVVVAVDGTIVMGGSQCWGRLDDPSSMEEFAAMVRMYLGGF